MRLRHLEWLIGEPVPDPDLVFYEVLPYMAPQADRIIEHLCGLAGFNIGQANVNPEGAERVRAALQSIIEAARARQALLDLQAIEREIGRSPWRELLEELRHDRRRFAATMGDRSARIALRWALRDLGQGVRAGRRWLHFLVDHPAVLRRAIDRALETRLLHRDVGRIDRHDRVVLVEGVARAYHLLTGHPLGRSLTPEQRPTGPSLRLVRLCLEPLDPLVTDDAIVWTIRRVQAQPANLLIRRDNPAPSCRHVREAGRWVLLPASSGTRSGADAEGGRVDLDQGPTQDTEEPAQPAQGPDRAPDVNGQIAALVRLLARQAAREHLHRLANPDAEEITDED